MRRSLWWPAMVAALLLAMNAARADDLAGRWLTTGSTGNGQFAAYLTLDGRGGLQAEVNIAAARGAGGSGVTRCVGSYGVDGQTITFRWSSCTSCPAGGGCFSAPATAMPTGGPVVFLAPSMITIAGDRYTRQ